MGVVFGLITYRHGLALDIMCTNPSQAKRCVSAPTRRRKTAGRAVATGGDGHTGGWQRAFPRFEPVEPSPQTTPDIPGQCLAV
jgi:hypothetical protein